MKKKCLVYIGCLLLSLLVSCGENDTQDNSVVNLPDDKTTIEIENSSKEKNDETSEYSKSQGNIISNYEVCTVYDGIETEYEIYYNYESCTAELSNDNSIEVEYPVFFVNSTDEKINEAISIINDYAKKEANAQLLEWQDELSNSSNTGVEYSRSVGNPYVENADSRYISVSVVEVDEINGPSPQNNTKYYNVDIENNCLLSLDDLINSNDEAFIEFLSSELRKQEPETEFPDNLEESLADCVSEANWCILGNELEISFTASEIGATNDIDCVSAVISGDYINLQ